MKKIILLLLLFPLTLLAQDSKKLQVTEVELLQEEKESLSPYEKLQDGSIKLFEALKEHRKALAEGSTDKLSNSDNPKKQGKINEDLFIFLNSAYLYCSIQNGTCPEILESVLEIDIINTLLTDKATCLNTLKFWKSWIDHDMEERHGFQTNIVHVNQINVFNKEIRPRYLKCKDTVSGILENNKDVPDIEYFKANIELPEEQDHLEKTLALLYDIQENIPDLFQEIKLKFRKRKR